jgi:hypothetical protein
MCVRNLTSKGHEISRTSVVPLSVADQNSEIIKKRIETYEADLKASLGTRAEGIVPEDDDDTPQYEPYVDDSNTKEPIIEPDDYDLDELNRYILARVLIPQGGQLMSGRVLKRKRDDNGKLIGKSNKDPKLDTSIFNLVQI